MSRDNDALRRYLELIGVCLSIDVIATFTSKQHKEAKEYADACWDINTRKIVVEKWPKVPSFLAVDICKQFEEDLIND